MDAEENEEPLTKAIVNDAFYSMWFLFPSADDLSSEDLKGTSDNAACPNCVEYYSWSSDLEKLDPAPSYEEEEIIDSDDLGWDELDEWLGSRP